MPGQDPIHNFNITLQKETDSCSRHAAPHRNPLFSRPVQNSSSNFNGKIFFYQQRVSKSIMSFTAVSILLLYQDSLKKVFQDLLKVILNREAYGVDCTFWQNTFGIISNRYNVKIGGLGSYIPAT